MFGVPEGVPLMPGFQTVLLNSGLSWYVFLLVRTSLIPDHHENRCDPFARGRRPRTFTIYRVNLQRKERENVQPMKPMKPTKIWYVYMVRCCDNTLYTGITTNIGRRIKEHNGPGSKTRYTRSRQPVQIVYHERAANRSEAGKRECLIKKMTRQQKEKLISATSRALEGIEAKQ